MMPYVKLSYARSHSQTRESALFYKPRASITYLNFLLLGQPVLKEAGPLPAELTGFINCFDI